MDKSSGFAFFEALRYFYESNKGKLRRNYKELSKKYLDYNDKEINRDAFLRKPQFEALEMYIFIKEFLQNKQMFQIFDEWIKKEKQFADSSFYSTDSGQVTFYDTKSIESKNIFTMMKKNSEIYPNYIFALTMGLGKTILMATCIFYEFLLANKYPKDKRFCHNALVFAPDKTVLESLREIQTFDKSLVIPPEYARVLDSNIKFHFLDDTGTTLNTIDNSDFNIIISNTQKIIIKQKHKESSATDKVFNMSRVVNNSPLAGTMNQLYGNLKSIENDGELLRNQRFEKLTRLQQLGIYVDEAHHMFGKDLEKAVLKNKTATSLRNTINTLASELTIRGTQVVACYNYTGTPYVKNTILPEVVYSYGLKDSISAKYLKSLEILGYENVKNIEFLKSVIKDFWNKYGDKEYEGLKPKLAIFGASIEEISEEVKPIVESILEQLRIPLSKILINVGDDQITQNEDIREFNNLDKVGSIGADKQFVLLVNKGREGWNCRSLFGVALFRSPKSKVFVLQATMRCLRQITDVQQKATVYLSKENMEILDDELKQNFRVSIEEINKIKNDEKEEVTVKVRKIKKIKLKRIKHNYKQEKIEYKDAIDFDLKNHDFSKYETTIYKKENLSALTTVKKTNADEIKENIKYTRYTLIAETARYMNEKCILIQKIYTEAVDGFDYILEVVNKYNDVLYDIIIPKILHTLYKITHTTTTEEKDVKVLDYPKDGKDFKFHAKHNLIIHYEDDDVREYRDKSFNADAYCFDSKPEKELFWQYIMSDKVKEIYFTGMFTNDENGLFIQYADPDTHRIRKYYPDFLAKLDDDTYEIIEVKGDNKIDDEIVQAKRNAAEELALESHMTYKMIAGNYIMNNNILETNRLFN